MKKLAIAGASLALAAMPVVGVFAQDLSVVDTIQITVSSACTFDEDTTTDGEDTKDTTYADTVANGHETTFSGTHSGNHLFHVTCNAPGGWTFSATPTNLAGHVSSSDSTTNNDSIPFVSSTAYGSSTPSGVAGKWTATIASTELPSGVTITQPATAGSSNTIITATGAQAASAAITSTYKAYVGTETAAGYYDGTISYTLALIP